MDCIFCKIAGGEIKTDFVYQDEFVVAFTDISPQAPIHIIVIPRTHVERVQDLDNENMGLMGRIFSAVQRIAVQKNIDKSGYRLVINCDKDAGQEVFHVHVHLLGGRKFTWPPG